MNEKRIPLHRCSGYRGCWIWKVEQSKAHLYAGHMPAIIPPSAKSVDAVLLKRRLANSFAIYMDGTVEDISKWICKDWRNRIRRLYRNGWRYVQFEYE